MDSASGFLPGFFFQGDKIYFNANFCCFRNQISGGGGQKSLKGAPLWKKARLETVLCHYLIIFMNDFQQE